MVRFGPKVENETVMVRRCIVQQAHHSVDGSVG